MAITKTRAKTINLTRNELVQGTAKRFLDIAADNGGNCEFHYDRLDVMIRMELVKNIEIIIYDSDSAIGGVALCFDWDKHTAEIEANGEFIDPNLINQYGATDNITDTLELVRAYVSGMIEGSANGAIEIWYCDNPDRVRQLGKQRIDQLLDRKPRSEAEAAETRERWSKIVSDKTGKSRSRSSTFADLPEASIKAW